MGRQHKTAKTKFLQSLRKKYPGYSVLLRESYVHLVQENPASAPAGVWVGVDVLILAYNNCHLTSESPDAGDPKAWVAYAWMQQLPIEEGSVWTSPKS